MAKKLPSIVKQIQKYEPHKIDYSSEKSISFSQMSIFYGCPYRWYLSYIEGKAPYKPSIAATFGTALHNTLQHWLDILYNESASKADAFIFEKYFYDELVKAYKVDLESNGGVHFSNKQELQEYYYQGLAILDYIKKKRKLYFTTRKVYLVGVEIPIVQLIKPGIYFKGYIDVVFYDERVDEFLILDIKTATRGWNDYYKKDPIKTSQLLLYRKFFAEQFGIPIDKIKTQYFIVKRIINEEAEFPEKRVQEFSPTQGKIKMGQASRALDDFVGAGFNEGGLYNQNGNFYTKPSKNNCRFCPFKDDKELCKVGIS